VIDLHCHILPALDDGALDTDDSIAMGRQADADGIELVCATPHIRHDHDVAIDTIAERVERLNTAFAERGLSVRVTTGGEVAEPVARGLSERERDLVSLGAGRRWLLIEPAPGPLARGLVELAAELGRAGRRIVVAHPERHLGPGTAECLEAVVAHGGLVQATAADVGTSGDGPLIELAARGLIHVLGSDARSSRAGRTVALRAALERLSQLPELAGHGEWIAESAPAAIVNGEDVSAPFAPAR
jgi:protein-tyrosine phosphatase